MSDGFQTRPCKSARKLMIVLFSERLCELAHHLIGRAALLSIIY